MSTHAVGAQVRQGPFRSGDRVQLTDPKGRLTTITLQPGAVYHTHRGSFAHDELLGRPEGTVVGTNAGLQYLAFRPLLTDYVLSMPRGAAVIYPKDAAMIVTLADIYPGARVVEAGVGSGALTLSLLRAVGEAGSLLSIERREDFADIARANVENFFAGQHPAWELALGDFDQRVVQLREASSVDRVVLDMLAPWENIAAARRVLTPGGVLLAYIATTTQMSRFVEALKVDGGFTEPQSWETIVRDWHHEGLAVRPEHRMIGHTGFLTMARRLAPDVTAPDRQRRPAPGAYSEDMPDFNESDIARDVRQQEVSQKKLRRIRREQATTARLRGESQETDESDDSPREES